MPELAELLYALRLEPEHLETIIEGLDLADEDQAELLGFLADVALFEEIEADWTFLDTDDVAQLIALLNERDLTAEQLARLLPRMGLAESLIVEVLAGLNLSSTELADAAEQLDVSVPLTATPTPTPAAEAEAAGASATSILSNTLSLTLTPTVTGTRTTAGTPTGTPGPEAYPGPLPTPTGDPGSYPYPGPLPTPAGDSGSYPGPDEPTATPDYQSLVYCVGDDLRIVATEPTWVEGTSIEVWAEEELLFTGEMGPDDEPLEITLPGPGAWAALRLEASAEPIRVPLGAITCPAETESGTETPTPSR
jgi:hypothetical protein